MNFHILQGSAGSGTAVIPRIARRGRVLAAQGNLPAWPLSPFVGALRATVQAPTFALLKLVAPTVVRGADLLENVEPPVLFAANHTSHLDAPVFLNALPPAWRRRVAVGAAADYFFANPWVGAGAALMVNAFPISRTGSPLRSIEQCAWLLDRGWSILIFPEGTRSLTGEMGNFKGGIGLLAVRLGVPVVPALIEGVGAVLPKGHSMPRPGRVSVTFGDPVSFEPDVTYSTAAASIQRAVRSLATGEVSAA